MKKVFLTLLFLYSFMHGDAKLSKATYNNLMQIQKLTTNKQYKQALKLVNDNLAKDIHKGDKAYLLQSKGFIYTSLNKYKKAMKAFEEMIKLNVMGEEVYLRTIYNLAQLASSFQEYKKSISYLKEYIQKNKIQNSNAHVLLGQNYIMLEKFQQSIPYLKKAIEIKQIKKQKVPIGWYSLLFSSYYKIKDYDNGIKCLDIMVRLKPTKKEYWEYLYQLHTLKKNFKKGLNVFEQAYNLKLLEGKDILRFVGFLATNKLYFKSAKLLDKHIKTKDIKANEKNLTLLYSLYYSAKEYQKSLKALDKLVKVSKKSKHYLEKARLHNIIHEDKKAIKAYEIALKDKKLKGYPMVIMELAYLYYELENKHKCEQCLNIAKQYKQTKEKALKFLKHM